MPRGLTIAVVGCWHQAAVVSACLAELGHRVTGIGEDAAAIAGLNRGQAPVFEPGLDALIGRNLEAGRLRYTTDYAQGLAGAELAFVCIDTPVDDNDESDLGPIERAAAAIALGASASLIVCSSAQTPVGTTHRLAAMMRELRPELVLPVVYVPEFLRLGSAIETFQQADRFVIGADDPRVAAAVGKLYEPLGRPVHLTDVRSAEMAKHASNAFLATSISFINQLADLCEQVGADVTEVAAIMRLDRRIGPHAFVSAGLGYAGGTLGRELRALHHLGERFGVETGLFGAVERVNAGRVPGVVARLERLVGPLAGRRVGILGLTYKPGTSTLRRSAGLTLADLLLERGASAAAVDPLARAAELPAGAALEWCGSVEQAAQGASALVLLTPWAGLADMDFERLGQVMARRVFLDTGNFLPPDRLEAAGFEYAGTGRGKMVASWAPS